MTFSYPFMLVVAVVVSIAAVAGYVALHRRRAAALASTGLLTGRTTRHLPYVFFLLALPVLLVGAARPEAIVKVPRASGTVMLVVDASNSMTATDLDPSRLGAAQRAATEFVKAQPDSVDIGVVVFGQTALNTQVPTDDHDEAIAAINRLKPGGGTSLGQAILAALSAIVGEPVTLPADGDPPANLGYWRSATIVLLSDGENTGGPDAEQAALVASDAGVRIETVGIGTERGTTIEVDGYELATALNADVLTMIAKATGGSYHAAGDAESLRTATRSIDLRITMQDKLVELTAVFTIAAIVLLTIGALLMIRWYGRVV
ncbi:VWA domain-containing protein [Virgisporangium ochraceum]|uniref:Membrane protein n=1 Tax=Virgisporangium ochraceum TaxID=65505 RepID=A0A8J3ZUZ1_9ACTN|nr:VWA domain-containing protein [Virgisporangium ochraceum]GIJ68940.1 membrane protein [Virgisporangium ochraceum]